MPRLLLCVLSSLLVAPFAAAGGPSAGKFFTDSQVRRLAESAATGDTAELARLVDAGVSVNATGRGRVSPALWALLHQSKKGLAFLLAHGADPNVQLTEDFDELLVEGVSTMSFAARHEDSWYLNEVLSHGGNPNLVNAVRSHTPIFDSIDTLRPENVKLLIAHGADLNWQDRDGNTPVVYAATVIRYDFVFWMLEAGADPKTPNKGGKTLADRIATSEARMDHTKPLYQWRLRVIEWLKKPNQPPQPILASGPHG